MINTKTKTPGQHRRPARPRHVRREWQTFAALGAFAVAAAAALLWAVVSLW